ncbi:MAG: hypothetical protein OEN01_02610 [Candidatus Krumholzibacteria bacterium]|nr:hypothetical protein [Candidatus Krumholzibacteria bacterium]
MTRAIRFIVVIAVLALAALPAMPEPPPDNQKYVKCRIAKNFTALVVKPVGDDYTITCQNMTPARLVVVHPGDYISWENRLAKDDTLDFALNDKRLFRQNVNAISVAKENWSVAQIWKDAAPGTTQYGVRGRKYGEHPGPGIIVCPPGQQPPCPQ